MSGRDGEGQGEWNAAPRGAVGLLRALKNKSQRHFAAKLSIFSIFRSCLKLVHSSRSLSLSLSVLLSLFLLLLLVVVAVVVVCQCMRKFYE